MVYFAPLDHLSPTTTVLLQSRRPIVSTPRRPKSVLSGDQQSSFLVKLFHVLAFAGSLLFNFLLSQEDKKGQERDMKSPFSFRYVLIAPVGFHYTWLFLACADHGNVLAASFFHL